MKPVARVVCLIPLLVWATAAGAAPPGRGKQAAADEADARPAVRIERWLVLGPASHPWPAFHDEKRGALDLGDVLEAGVLPLERDEPSAGDRVPWFAVTELSWIARDTARDGTVTLARPSAPGPAVAWLATYVECERWVALELEVLGEHPRRAWLDGEPVAKGTKGEVKADVDLIPGKHRLLVETVLDPGRKAAWSAGARLVTSEKDAAAVGAVAPTLAPERDLTLADVLDPPQVESLAVSPDGREVALSIRRIVPGTDESESWIEIRPTGAGSPAQVWRGALAARQVDWSPDGRWLSWVADAAGAKSEDSAEKKDEHPVTLWLLERATREVRALAEAVEGIDSYRWVLDGGSIVYAATSENEEEDRAVKHVESLMDRWASYRDKSYLYQIHVPGGARRRLTAGAETTEAQDVSPDGRRLLFTRVVEDVAERPYSRSELWELDLSTLVATKLRDFRWFHEASYSPDGARLAVLAGAGEFAGAGVGLPAGTLPNSYEGELFLWKPGAEDVDPITATFDPSVSQVWWLGDGRLYLSAWEGSHKRLYRWNASDRVFQRLATGFDVVDEIDFARDASRVVATGTSPWQPEDLVAIDLGDDTARRLEHPARDSFEHVRVGRVEPWEFTTARGLTITGHIYLPPAFDPARKYPAIVYYYGGTTPTERAFGGRYPKEWWAANGYVVWVLQPSGAIGFGSSFAASHVNDWGGITSEEILEGTRRFLEAHPWVDSRRVGAIGASYGGFMTMLLATKTDQFAAAVAHAGISSLASYWGEGYWGYSYSAVATAGSFPWNRPDLYVEHSPLFRADRTRVPILLTHGRSDTNVPVGESDQFFVALKMLGLPVEYVQIEGQDHHILDHAKRTVWSNTILAWWERWLKDQPAWWDDLYGPPDDEDEDDADADEAKDRKTGG